MTQSQLSGARTRRTQHTHRVFAVLLGVVLGAATLSMTPVLPVDAAQAVARQAPATPAAETRAPGSNTAADAGTSVEDSATTTVQRHTSEQASAVNYRTVTFSTLTPASTREFVVPPGVTSLSVEAQGGTGSLVPSTATASPGSGAYVTSTLPVIPGETYYLTAGGNAVREVPGAGGGAAGTVVEGLPLAAGGGGGASDLRRGNLALSARVLVAGGGGGAASQLGAIGGSAGGVTGGVGLTTGGCTEANAGGGTSVSGGLPGGPCTGTVGQAGGFGVGGTPGYRVNGNNIGGGGGGGGGWYGGGGGSPFGGGGAGSSYVTPQAQGTSYAVGPLNAEPFVRVSYQMPLPSVMSLTLSAATMVADGQSQLTATVQLNDGDNTPIVGDTVTIESDDPGQQISEVTNHLDGSYSATVTASPRAGSVRITARDVSAGPGYTVAYTLTQIAGPATTISLSPANSTLAGNGTATVQLGMTVRDAFGNLASGHTLGLSSSDPRQRISAVTDAGDGSYSATLTSSTTPGEARVTATVLSAASAPSAYAQIIQLAGPAAKATVSLDPASLVADGISTTTGTVYLTDAVGNPLAGEPLSVGTSDPDQLVKSIVDNGGGSYTFEVVASETVGTAVVRVDALSVPGVKATATLTQTVGPIAAVEVALDPATLVADGAATTTATVRVADAQGRGLAGNTVTVTSSDPNQQLAAVTDRGDGTYTVELTATETVGAATITATAGAVAGRATLTQTLGPVALVHVALDPAMLVADGAATTSATVRVADAQGRPRAGETVTLTSSDPEQGIGAVTDNGDGSYTAQLTASAAVGAATITAGVGSASGVATLTQTAGSPDPARSELTLSAGSIVADGKAETEITVRPRDAQGRPLPATALRLSSTDAGQRLGAFEEVEPGVFTATVRASTRVGTSTLTVRTTVQPIQPVIPPEERSAAALVRNAPGIARATVGAGSPVPTAGVLGEITLTQTAPKAAPVDPAQPVKPPAPAPASAPALAATGADSGAALGWIAALVLAAGAAALLGRRVRRRE